MSATNITVFGIPNCDTVKKARTWLSDQGIAFAFHDVKKNGLERSAVEAWLTQIPLDTLINRKGTTWRALSDAQKSAATDRDAAIDLMLASPSVIKRPVLDIAYRMDNSNGNGRDENHTIRVGFSVQEYQSLFTAI